MDAQQTTGGGEGEGGGAGWLERSVGPSADELHRANGGVCVRGGRSSDELEDEPCGNAVQLRLALTRRSRRCGSCISGGPQTRWSG